MENNIKVFRVHRVLSWFYGLSLLLLALTTITIMQDDGDVTFMLVVMTIIGGVFSLHCSVAKGAKQKKLGKAGVYYYRYYYRYYYATWLSCWKHNWCVSFIK